MTVKIQRGRQFLAGDVTAQLFDDKGKAGTYLKQASEKLVASNNSVLLKKGTSTLKLSTAAEWKAFMTEHASTKAKTADFPRKFGITFEDFCNVVDDLAVSDDKGLSLNLSPNSNVSKALSLDKVEGNYASKMTAESTVKLTGVGVKSDAKLVPTPVIGPDILAKPIDMGWDRNRTEQEAWADFKMGNGANKIFKDTGAIATFEKMHKPKWDDPAAMELVEKFTMPMHLEQTTKPDGTVSFQNKDEMFRETYFDDASGALAKAGASVRARVRFDDKPPFAATRVLIQGKEGRAVDADGNSAVHKFEKRFDGSYSGVDEAKAQELLRNGKDPAGGALEVAAILYKTAQDKGTLPVDKNLRLDAKSVVLQKRQRSHMQFENVSDVQSKRTALKTEMDALKATNKPIPPAMQKYDDKLAAQEKFLTDAGALLSKHGQYLPSNTDGFIISADRYSVYDPAARKEVPTDIDDETGRVGRGLHLEAEWDTASSDPFEKAAKSIREKLAATPAPANKPELEADLAKLNEFSKAILKDVEAAVNLMKQRMEAAGLKSDDRHLSKEERAAEFMERPDRPVIWQ